MMRQSLICLLFTFASPFAIADWQILSDGNKQEPEQYIDLQKVKQTGPMAIYRQVPVLSHGAIAAAPGVFRACFAEIRKFTARNQVRKSHEVLRQTGFETPFPGCCHWSQSGAQSKKPRVVRGLRLPQGLLSRFEVFVLAESVGFEPTIPF